jgi:hypothetical protein
MMSAIPDTIIIIEQPERPQAPSQAMLDYEHSRMLMMRRARKANGQHMQIIDANGEKRLILTSDYQNKFEPPARTLRSVAL